MANLLFDITDDDGHLVREDLLRSAEAVHRELRPQLPPDYLAKMKRVFAEGGRMSVVMKENRVLGLAVYRWFEDTFNGRKFYCDDLVTTESGRSTGVGHALMQHMEAKARAHGCPMIGLDSGVQRGQAHKFYFREGMVVTSFNFKKALA